MLESYFKIKIFCNFGAFLALNVAQVPTFRPHTQAGLLLHSEVVVETPERPWIFAISLH